MLTAMSTTLGIGTIVGPVIAIHLGGPGALIGFILTSVLGSAATYTEVNLCIQYRKKMENGEIIGGPMQYLKVLISPFAAKWYAVCCFILMMAWSGAQANQLSAILDSPLLGVLRVPTYISGAAIALLIMFTLMGGIKRIGSFSAKLVPTMFTLFIGSSLWILFSNYDRLGEVWGTVIQSAFSPMALASGSIVGGIVSSMRWGIFKGIQVTEAGIGTQTIPHSMAETKDPVAQGTLAMCSTYSAGLVACLSGTVSLVTDTWMDPNLPLGISMVAASYQQYFSVLGIFLVAIITFLFGFGTILGNSFNGSQCFGYLTNNKGKKLYYSLTALMIFMGAIMEVKTVWSYIDIALALMAVPHMSALMLYAFKKPSEAKVEEPQLQTF